MSRAGRVAACYVALWVGNDVADHLIQTDEQAAGKAHADFGHWAGPMLGHLTGLAATQGVVLAALRAAGVDLGFRRALCALTASVASHGFIDRRWPVTALLERTGSARFAHPQIGPLNVRGTVEPAWARGGWSAIVGGTDATQLPLHGPYLADQALHHAVCLLAALIAGGGR